MNKKLKIGLKTDFWKEHKPEKTEKFIFKQMVGITLIIALIIFKAQEWIIYIISGWLWTALMTATITYNKWRQENDEQERNKPNEP